MNAADSPKYAKTVSLRLISTQYEALKSAASDNGLPLAALARVFFDFSLTRLQHGDDELLRAIRISRGG